MLGRDVWRAGTEPALAARQLLLGVAGKSSNSQASAFSLTKVLWGPASHAASSLYSGNHVCLASLHPSLSVMGVSECPLREWGSYGGQRRIMDSGSSGSEGSPHLPQPLHPSSRLRRSPE